MTERFLSALEYTYELHALQRRKGPEPAVSYLGHLLGVSSLVIDDGGSEDEAIAALLHDAVEDAGGHPTLEEIRRRFGDHVAGIVEQCSDTDVVPKPPWRERKEAYISRLGEEATSPDVLRVVAADKLQNVRSMMDDYRRHGETLWERFSTGSAADQLWYYQSVVAVLLSRRPGPLSYELDRTVTVLDWIVSAGGFERAGSDSGLSWEKIKGAWWATGRTGTEWEISPTAQGRFAITVGRWDEPDWSADTLADAQQLCFEIDRRPPFWQELMTTEWVPTD